MILFNFSVLARQSSEFNLRQPEPQGIELWRALGDASMSNVGVVVNEWMPREQIDNWLTTYRMKSVLVNSLDTTDPALKASKVQQIMAALGRMDWYVDTDPPTIAETLKLGIPSLLMAVPYSVRPEWHDSSKPAQRTWGALVEEIDRQNRLRMEREE
jgi:hypothetical protein